MESDLPRTTCPSCRATFRVRPEQLAARNGTVRCGKCAFVFNAFDNLVTPIETVSLIAPEAPTTAAEMPPPVAAPTMSEPVANFPLPSDEQIERETAEINRAIAESAAEVSMREDAATPPPKPRPKLEITPELKEKLADLQQQLTTQQRRAHWRTLALSLGVLSLLLLLVLQVAYFRRDQIAAHYPPARPALEAMCRILDCRIGLLADATLIKLESSDLQAEPETPGRVTLSVTLRNLAPYPQAYPMLELTLTDAAHQPLARRQFSPREYLAPTVKAEAGFPAAEELVIRLPLDLGALGAVGYKLYVYYP